MSPSTEYNAEFPVEVKSGQTSLLEIEARAKGSAVQGSFEVNLGSFEINLVNARGEPVKMGPIYIVRDIDTIIVDIDEEGHGKRYDIPEGIYTVTLQKPSGETGPVKLDQVIYFGFDSSRLTTSADSILEEIALFLTKPEQTNVTKLECRGYTDSVGSDTYNKNLSLKRAIAVRNALVDKLNNLGVKNISTATALGKGELENKKAQNRRVEFFITRSGLSSSSD